MTCEERKTRIISSLPSSMGPVVPGSIIDDVISAIVLEFSNEMDALEAKIQEMEVERNIPFRQLF
jgi:hypothetical protein